MMILRRPAAVLVALALHIALFPAVATAAVTSLFEVTLSSLPQHEMVRFEAAISACRNGVFGRTATDSLLRSVNRRGVWALAGVATC